MKKFKFVREKQDLSEISHIFSLINGKIDLDREITKLSASTLKLDEQSVNILSILSKNGPTNEYQLGKLYNGRDRYTVRRRIYGTKTKPSLQKNSFVILVNNSKPKTKRAGNTWRLDFNGILALLNKMKFEDNPKVKEYYNYIRGLTDNNEKIVDCSIVFAKYQIALVLCWYKMVGQSLTKIDTVQNLFIEGVNLNMLFGSVFMFTDKEDWKLCFEIGKKFLVIREILKLIILKNCNNPKSTIFSNLNKVSFPENWRNFTDKVKAKAILESLTKDWAFNISRSFDYSYISNGFSFVPFVNSVSGYTFPWKNAEKEIGQLLSKVMLENGLKGKKKINLLKNIKFKHASFKADSMDYWPVYASFDKR